MAMLASLGRCHDMQSQEIGFQQRPIMVVLFFTWIYRCFQIVKV